MNPNFMSVDSVRVPASLAIILMTSYGTYSVQAATPANATSPLGINVLQINYWTPEQPFLNIFKTTGVSHATPTGWWTHSSSAWDTHEEAYLQLDADGYPKSLTANYPAPHPPQRFDSVGILMLRELPNADVGAGLEYRPGKYVVLYDGQGTLAYEADARLVSASPGRDVIEVLLPSSGGVGLRITATDPNHTGNHIRNIRVVKAEEEPLLKAGQVFRPGFLNLLRRFRVIRGVQWLNVDEQDGGRLTNWSDRPLTSDAGWGSKRGVPLEVVLQLCNAIGADCWLNVPHRASDEYISRMAILAQSMLGAGQKVYVEFSNEVWNPTYEQYHHAVRQGQATWPAAGATPDEYNRNWYGMRTAQMCDIWKAVWGADAARVVCVLGAQSVSTETATLSLICPFWVGPGNGPCYKHHIDTVAISPYFGFSVPATWARQPDGGLRSLFASMTTQNDPIIPPGGWLATVTRSAADFHAALAAYKLPLIAYEGGQSFVGFPTYDDGSGVVKLYIAANRDPRMGAVYTAALKTWRENGGQAWLVFGDIYAPSKYGEWGALESFLDTVDPLSKAPPKWQAIQNFISNNPCWWKGCEGHIADIVYPTVQQPGVQ
jgi:hypothetical protein